VQEAQQHQHQRVEAHAADVEAEQQEQLVVAHAHAVVHPRAVVVHLEQTAKTRGQQNGKVAQWRPVVGA
jgi:hypothetical protein